MCTQNDFKKLSLFLQTNKDKYLPLNIESLKEVFSMCNDFQYRKINIGLEGNIYIHICWLDGLVSGQEIADNIIKPLTTLLSTLNPGTTGACIDSITKGSVYSYSLRQRQKLEDIVQDLCHGCCGLIFDDCETALSFETRSPVSRSISEPTLEKSLKGARDSFVELLRTNTAMVRKRICSPLLKLSESSIGRKSHTGAAIMFIEGIADPKIVEQAAERLDSIDVDGLLSMGYLEEALTDNPLSPFPQLIHTERPDRFAMYLMDGRVGILVDGLPVGLVLPVSFSEFMKVTSDSNMHFLVSSCLNMLRYLALMLSLFLPAFYVAVAMYHQEMIPSRLLLSIIEAKHNVPFSTAIEVLSMIIAFALLQEAGLRLPNPIGDTVSIIGALIVGQSAVEAQVVSPIAIIVVAVSGIACYTLPSQDMGAAVRLMQLGFLISAILGGLFGIAAAICLMLLLLSSMDSFGINYTAPLSDGKTFSLFRLLIHIPKLKNKFRDPKLNTADKRRQK